MPDVDVSVYIYGVACASELSGPRATTGAWPL